MQLDLLLRENYVLPSDLEIRKTLNELTLFINHIHIPFEDQKADLTTIRVIEIAFKHFKSLENQTQNSIFQFTQRLIDQNQVLCFDEITRDHYQKIVLLWTRFTYLQTAIGHICIFLTPLHLSSPLTEKELDRAQCLIAFAIKYFQSLEENTKVQLHHLAYLIKNPLLHSSLSNEKHYQFFVKHLQNLPSLQPSPLSQFPIPIIRASLTWKEEPPPLPSTSKENKKNFINVIKDRFKPPSLSITNFEKTCVVVSEESSIQEKEAIKVTIEKELKEKRDTQQNQLLKICTLSHQFFQYYFPLSWLGTQKQQQQFLKDFDQHYPPIAKELFFQQSSSVSPLQFQIISQILHQIVHFLKNFNDKDSVFLQLSNEEINDLLTTMLNQAFQRWQPKTSPMNSFVSLLTVNVCLQLIDNFLNPDSFYFLLERLLSSEPWDLEDFNSKKIPLKMFSTDQKLTDQLASILEALGKELILLGEPQWSAKVASTVLEKIIEVKKYSCARKIQQIVSQIKSSPCSMKPLLVIHQILFCKEQNELQATWFAWQRLDPEKKALRKQAIEKNLNERLYQVILAEIKQQSSFAGWLVNNASSIQIFCQNLSQRLWQVFQQEKTIKLLAFYLLQGIEKATISELKSTDS